ncbi:hypothetical protein JO861_19025 [Rhodococcus hoagii]|uniref:hypothetical protein n=1 Tax=Rhodococcus hoagii TaxID=43767 RepID=UPI001965E139|nr:hypothetical protein [Prescottella equi]MBM9838644.1 hypothetical protein [Prescottella equi]
MRFAARSIPNSSAVTAVRDGAYRPAIKAGAGDPGIDAAWARLIGTVIDFRLRLAFTTANLVPPTAQRGHAALTRRHPDAAPLLAGLTDAIGVALGAEGPMDGSQIELPGRTEDDLIRLCVVAGQLDQLYRNYESVSRATPLLAQDRVVTVEQAVAQVPGRVVDDLHEQVRIANDGLGPLRAATTRATAGLEFAGSHLIGADADLLVDGLLLDFKAKNEPTTIKKPDVYQLAGYVLLDFDDTHRIDRVGIYWTRHGVMRTFPVTTFLELLGATAPIADLRGQLHNELSAYAQQVRRARAARLAAEERSGEQEQPVAIEQLPLPDETKLARSVRWLRGVLRR